VWAVELSSGTGRVRRWAAVGEFGVCGLGGSTGKVCADPSFGEIKQANKTTRLNPFCHDKGLGVLVRSETNREFAGRVFCVGAVFCVIVGLSARE